MAEHQGFRFAAGLLLNWIDPAAESIRHAGHSMLPAWVGTGSAAVLLAVLGTAIVRRFVRRAKAPEAKEGQHVITLAISGMTCSHCVSNVERALKGCAGVEKVAVDLKGGRVVVIGKEVGGGMDEAELRRSAEEAGYKVTGVEVEGRESDGPTSA